MIAEALPDSERCPLLIEQMAGHKGILGTTLEEVEAIRAVSATTDRDQFNRDLFQLIVEETVRQAAAAQYSIVEDPAAVDAQYDLFIAGIEAEGPLDEYLETNGITEETIRHDHEFWNWYTKRLTDNPKFLRDVVARRRRAWLARRDFSELEAALPDLRTSRVEAVERPDEFVAS